MNVVAVALAAALAATPGPPASPQPSAGAASPQASTAGTTPSPKITPSFPTPAPVDGLTVDDIVAKWRAASGGDKKVSGEISVWKLHESGLDGTIRTVYRGADYVETTQLGSSANAWGSYRGKSWYQNANGQVIIEEDLPEDADVRTSSQHLRHVTNPVDAYVVETVSSDGTSHRRYYDAKSFLLVRKETTDRLTTYFTVFDDFVSDAAGRTFARHAYGKDERPDSDWDERLVSDEVGAKVSDSELAIPHDRRVLVEFPAGQSTVRLPARIIKGFITVRVTINGRGLDFLLDSGASSMLVDAHTASELGLQIEGRRTTSINGELASSDARIPEMQIGDLTLRDVAVRVAPSAFNADWNTKAVGLLGFDFCHDVVLTIDYKNGTVDATAPKAFKPDPAATELAVRMNDGQPEIALLIGSERGDRFVLDTGAQQTTVTVFQHFARLHPKAVSLKNEHGNPLLEGMLQGVVVSRQVLLPSVSLGPWTFRARAQLMQSPVALDAQDGLIGSDLLQIFRVTLDESHSTVYLMPLVPL